MKNSLFFFFICHFIFWTTGCQNQSGNADLSKVEASAEEFQTITAEVDESEPPQFSDETPPPSPPEPPQPQKQPEKPDAPITRQIIKTANYRIQVKNVDESTRQANAMAARHGGYISGSELTNSSYEITNRITIRVPAARFDSLLNNLGNEAIFTQYKKISSEDVTAEYVDVLIRLKTKKEVRDRYVDILRNKARTVQDVLKAEEQIRIIQEEIEAKEGRLRYLKDQVGMSTIHLEMYQSIEYRPEPTAFHESFWSQLLTGLKNGWLLLQGIALFFVNIWPLIILGALIWWRRRWIWAKIRRR